MRLDVIHDVRGTFLDEQTGFSGREEEGKAKEDVLLRALGEGADEGAGDVVGCTEGGDDGGGVEVVVVC